MYALIKDNKFTGTVYEELRQDFINHAEKYNLAFAEIDYPLQRDEDDNITTEPTVGQIEAGRTNVIQFQLEQIDIKYASDRSWREFVINNPDQFSDQAVARMQEAEDKASELRANL
jgi:hypothetical protein